MIMFAHMNRPTFDPSFIGTDGRGQWMDIELSRLRNKNKSGYTRLESNDGESPTTAPSPSNPSSSSRTRMSSSRTGRTYGYNDNKGKGKGRAKYTDEPEDEVDLLRADELGEQYADDEHRAEEGQREPPKVGLSLYMRHRRAHEY